MYKRFFKRWIDFVLALLGLLVFSLPMLIIALLIKIDSPGPVLFKQKRIGQGHGGQNHFYIYKFRTMFVETPRDIPTHLLQGATACVTKIGAVLRRTSLDELPQLLNILKGDMSIVGPRPALWNQFDLIEMRDAVGANDVKPGLTGWAQINGRDELELEEKVGYDGVYVERLSFSFDCKCFFGTVGSVLRQEGVVPEFEDDLNSCTQFSEYNIEEVDPAEKHS